MFDLSDGEILTSGSNSHRSEANDEKVVDRNLISSCEYDCNENFAQEYFMKIGRSEISDSESIVTSVLVDNGVKSKDFVDKFENISDLSVSSVNQSATAQVETDGKNLKKKYKLITFEQDFNDKENDLNEHKISNHDIKTIKDKIENEVALTSDVFDCVLKRHRNDAKSKHFDNGKKLKVDFDNRSKHHHNSSNVQTRKVKHRKESEMNENDTKEKDREEKDRREKDRRENDRKEKDRKEKDAKKLRHRHNKEERGVHRHESSDDSRKRRHRRSYDDDEKRHRHGRHDVDRLRNKHDSHSKKEHRRHKRDDGEVHESYKKNHTDDLKNNHEKKHSKRHHKENNVDTNGHCSFETFDLDMKHLDDLVDEMAIKETEEEILERRRMERQKIMEKHLKESKETLNCNSVSVETLCDNYSKNSTKNPSSVFSPITDESNEDLLLEKSHECLNSKDTGDLKDSDRVLNGATKLDLDENKTHNSVLEKKRAENDDMFDMFAEEFDVEHKKKLLGPVMSTKLDTTKLVDNGDDLDGYYKVVIGEQMNNRYAVYGLAGRGVFSSVIRARDTEDNDKEVAIKMLRNNDMMRKQGLKELEILKKINQTDNSGAYHCVLLLNDFKHKNHLCLVFESLYINLRELVKKYGNGIGLSMKAVRTYSHQLFQALKLLRRLNIIHSDIKPDNIIVNHQKNSLKLCDFGSACYTDEAEITPYLVSRFYRPPEIILGLKYDCAVDLWSIACTIYEMYTGKILFPAKTNNEMIKFFMDLKGKVSHKLIRKSTLGGNHFDENYNFIYREFDKVTQKDRISVCAVVQPIHDLYEMLTRNQNLEEPIKKKACQLRDLLDKMLSLDSSKRPGPSQCCQHPFITEKSF